jgi:O-antigen ligase
VRFRLNADYGVPARPASVTARARANSSDRLMGLRGLPRDVALLLAYIILDGSYIGDQARLGIKIGPLPIFVSDAALIVLFAICMRKHTGRLLNWGFSGGSAGTIGRAVWLLFLMAIVYFALAFPEYRLYAVRDLAIFGYSLFFPLTYFALTRRIYAAKLVRCFVYAICAGAVLFNFERVSGIHLFELHQAFKGLPGGQEVPHLSADNLAELSSSLAGLLAYAAVQRKRRALHVGLLLLCLITLAELVDRSSFLGFCMAGGVLFVIGAGRSRRYLTTLAVGFCALLLLSAPGELPIPGGARLHGLWLALYSGANFQSDPDANFRLERWHAAVETWTTSPLFGVGFGVPILSDEWVRSEVRVAAQQDKMGSFNQGMPHNTFLMVLARTGPLGLGLICFAWIAVIIKLFKALRRRAIEPDRLAILGILVAMIPIAALNLFFERPMLCAPFWIMLAAGYKLAENVPAAIPRFRLGIAPSTAVWDWRQRSSYPQPARAASNYAPKAPTLTGISEPKPKVNRSGSSRRH